MRRRALIGTIGGASLSGLAGCPTIPWNGSDPTGDAGRRLDTRKGILYVDDQPIVPTGVYFWPDVSRPSGRNPFDDIASYGLNAVTAPYRYIRRDGTRDAGQPDVEDLRANAERLGMYFFLESPPPDDLAGKTDAELERVFGSLTDRVASSPYFLGWAVDEPAWRGIDLALIRRVTAAVRAHPVEQVLYFIYAPVDQRWSDSDWPDMAAYSAEADIVGHTFYPIDPGLPWAGYIGRHRLEAYGWYTDRLRRWVDDDTPIWNHQQGHRVGDLADPPTDAGRRPNRVETRFMSLQALVHGASGIFYFPGSKLGGAIPFDAPVWDRYIRETAAIVRSLAPILASTEPHQSVTTPSTAVRTLVGRSSGETVILAVRETDGPPERVRFHLSDTQSGSVRVWGENRDITVDGGSFADVFHRYGVHIYAAGESSPEDAITGAGSPRQSPARARPGAVRGSPLRR